MNSDNTSSQESSVTNASAAFRPTAQGILSGMKQADNPLDFIRANTPGSSPQTVDPQVVSETVKQQAAEQEQPKSPVPTEPAEPIESGVDFDLDLSTPTEPAEKPEEVEEPEESVDDEEVSEEDKTASANFKKLRTSMRQAKLQLQEKESEVENLRKKIEEYETGAAMPEVVTKLQEELEETQKYRDIVNLKSSPEYLERFIKPATQIKERLKSISDSYSIPFEKVLEATRYGNEADLNRFLSNHFDGVGALEVKNLVLDLQDIQQEAHDAEAKPQSALENLIAEGQQMQQERRQQELAVMSQAAKDAWMTSLQKIKEEGDAIELIHKEGDSEYNNKFVNPLIRNAATEYGKIVKLLANHGLTQLPKDLATALARMVQLSHASGVAIASRNAAIKQAEELQQNVARTTKYVRPSMNGVGGGSSVSTGKPAATAKEAGEQLIQSVMGKIA